MADLYLTDHVSLIHYVGCVTCFSLSAVWMNNVIKYDTHYAHEVYSVHPVSFFSFCGKSFNNNINIKKYNFSKYIALIVLKWRTMPLADNHHLISHGTLVSITSLEFWLCVEILRRCSKNYELWDIKAFLFFFNKIFLNKHGVHVSW